jgi:hypothetical protein
MRVFGKKTICDGEGKITYWREITTDSADRESYTHLY